MSKPVDILCIFPTVYFTRVWERASLGTGCAWMIACVEGGGRGGKGGRGSHTLLLLQDCVSASLLLMHCKKCLYPDWCKDSEVSLQAWAGHIHATRQSSCKGLAPCSLCLTTVTCDTIKYTSRAICCSLTSQSNDHVQHLPARGD